MILEILEKIKISESMEEEQRSSFASGEITFERLIPIFIHLRGWLESISDEYCRWYAIVTSGSSKVWTDPEDFYDEDLICKRLITKRHTSHFDLSWCNLPNGQLSTIKEISMMKTLSVRDWCLRNMLRILNDIDLTSQMDSYQPWIKSRRAYVRRELIDLSLYFCLICKDQMGWFC